MDGTNPRPSPSSLVACAHCTTGTHCARSVWRVRGFSVQRVWCRCTSCGAVHTAWNDLPLASMSCTRIFMRRPLHLGSGSQTRGRGLTVATRLLCSFSVLWSCTTLFPSPSGFPRPWFEAAHVAPDPTVTNSDDDLRRTPRSSFGRGGSGNESVAGRRISHRRRLTEMRATASSHASRTSLTPSGYATDALTTGTAPVNSEALGLSIGGGNVSSARRISPSLTGARRSIRKPSADWRRRTTPALTSGISCRTNRASAPTANAHQQLLAVSLVLTLLHGSFLMMRGIGIRCWPRNSTTSPGAGRTMPSRRISLLRIGAFPVSETWRRPLTLRMFPTRRHRSAPGIPGASALRPATLPPGPLPLGSHRWGLQEGSPHGQCPTKLGHALLHRGRSREGTPRSASASYR